MKIPFLFILTLYSHQAFASYENSCDLVVKLLENMTIETLAVARSDGLLHKGHIHLISFKGLVKKAQVSHRADTGCQHYLGTVLEDKIISDIRYTAKKGQKIKINIRIRDFKGKSQSDEIVYSSQISLIRPKRQS